MIRMLLLGLVVVMATLGGSYAAMQIPSGGASAPDETDVKAEAVRLDPVSVPIVRGGKIQGYVIGRYSFTAPIGDVRRDKDALILFVSEAIFRSVYQEEEIDFTALKVIEVGKLAERILTQANARMPQPVVKQVFIENLNFLAHDAVRCQQTR